MIRAAGAAGFDLVSLWFNDQAIYPGALVTAENLGECEAAMAETGVRLYTLEAFELTSTAAIRDLRPAFERGARLGGKVALCYHHGAVGTDEAAGLLAEFAGVAGEFGLGTCIEPIAMGGTATLAQAAALIRASGCDARILFDTWHLMRTGGGASELAALDPALLGYVQINDGLLTDPPEDAMAEVMGERLYLGSGEFPLAELLRITPRDIPWGIENSEPQPGGQGHERGGAGSRGDGLHAGLLAQL